MLCLLVTELVANSVKHASGLGTVRLEVTLTDEVARVEVHDPGPGFDPNGRTPESPLDSQWGLHLVETLTDRWGVDSEPTTRVWFEIDRTRTGDDRLQMAAAARRIGL